MENFKIKVLGGNNQIGGNCVEIEGQNSRIVLDLGMPLTDTDSNPTKEKLTSNKIKKYLPDISDLYTDKPQKETILLITHSHPDHFGLARYVNKNIPIYATKITKELLEKGSRLLWNNLYDNISITPINNDIETKDFIIKTYLVDHSIGGASAFKIIDKTSNKTILYSGDIRVHGRNGDLMTQLVENNKNVDYLILEGTTLSRDNYELETEAEIEEKLTKEFMEDKLNIVACSPLNTDRIISVYNATIKAGKVFVIDPYTAYVLESFKQDKRVPQFTSDDVLVYFAWNKQSEELKEDKTLYRYKKRKIIFDEIVKNPTQFVIKNNHVIFEAIIKRFKLDKLNLIYSYWSGYLEDENYSWAKYKNDLKIIHTSGHIDKDNLVKLVKDIRPKNIIPIHTLNSKKYDELFNLYSKILQCDKIC